jgi:hypothetical protein
MISICEIEQKGKADAENNLISGRWQNSFNTMIDKGHDSI